MESPNAAASAKLDHAHAQLPTPRPHALAPLQAAGSADGAAPTDATQHVLTYSFSAGLNNVLVSTQKALCIAAHLRRRAPGSLPRRCLLLAPLLSSHAKGGGHARDAQLEDFIDLTPDARRLVCPRSLGDAPPTECAVWDQCSARDGGRKRWESLASPGTAQPACVNLTCAFYLPDVCPGGSAATLPDVAAVSDKVRKYAVRLAEMTRLGAWGSWRTVQYRFGQDWANHNHRFRGSCISFADLQRQVQPAGGRVLVLKPPTQDAINGSATTAISARLDRACEEPDDKETWTGFCHSSHASDTMRIVSEMHLASQSNTFYYNRQSTFQHLISRIKSNRTQMVALSPRLPGGRRDDPACTM